MNSSQINLQLTHTEAEILQQLLNRLSQYQENAGCNDYVINNEDGNQELIAFTKRETEDCFINSDKTLVNTYDWVITQYFIDKITEQLK